MTMTSLTRSHKCARLGLAVPFAFTKALSWTSFSKVWTVPHLAKLKGQFLPKCFCNNCKYVILQCFHSNKGKYASAYVKPMQSCEASCSWMPLWPLSKPVQEMLMLTGNWMHRYIQSFWQLSVNNVHCRVHWTYKQNYKFGHLMMVLFTRLYTYPMKLQDLPHVMIHENNQSFTFLKQYAKGQKSMSNMQQYRS